MVHDTQPTSKLILTPLLPCEFQVVVLGDKSVGKTSVLRRYFGNSLNGDLEPTTKPTCMQKEVMYEGRPVHLKIWDTTVDLDMNMVVTGTVDGAIILYDVTKKETFDSVLKHWVSDLSNADGANVCVIIAGNKIDLEVDTMIPLDQIEGYARDIGAQHCRISAKEDKNIDEPFTVLTNWLMKIKAIKNMAEDMGISHSMVPSQTLDISTAPLEHPGRRKREEDGTCWDCFCEFCCEPSLDIIFVCCDVMCQPCRKHTTETGNQESGPCCEGCLNGCTAPCDGVCDPCDGCCACCDGCDGCVVM